jgi:hypothetical protein
MMVPHTLGGVQQLEGGLAGAMFNVIREHVPGRAGLQSSMRWGAADHLAGSFGDVASQTQSANQFQMSLHQSRTLRGDLCVPWSTWQQC